MNPVAYAASWEAGLRLTAAVLLLCCSAPAAHAQGLVRGGAMPSTNAVQGSNTITVTVFPYPHPYSTSGAGGTFQIALSNLASSLIRDMTWVQAGANLYAAKVATAAGGLISVGPGTYTIATNLLKAGLLTWEFHGSLLDVTGNVLDHGCGLFDDRFTGGAATNDITGSLTIRYCPGTNVHWDAVCTAIGNTNALGAIVVTNRQSLIGWSANTRIGVYGPQPYPSSIYIRNCASNSYFRTFEFFDLAPTRIINASNCTVLPGTPIDIDVAGTPIYWELGTASIEFTRAPSTGPYFINAYGVDQTDSDSLFVRGNFADGKAYLVGRSRNWKLWIDLLEWQNSSLNPNLFNPYGAGSHYVRAQVLAARSSPVIQSENPGGQVDTNLVTWFDVDKVKASNGFMRVTHGQVRGRIGHFEQNGPTDGTAGIFVTNISAFVSLTGENIATERTAVHHGGGRTELRGYHIVTTNRDPVLVTGAGFRPMGITLVVGLGATNAIRAGSAQNVANYGILSCKSNPHANVTFIVGASNVVVDPDVD